MPAISRFALAGCAIAFAVSSAGAVGLGPLSADGLTRTDRKGFYLTVINPYPTAERFNLYAVGWDDENAVERVRIPLDKPVLGPKSQRRLLVVATGLVPGEDYKFRVCAERIEPKGKGLVNARVCSKLTAHRVG
jgi:hypothetical protein